MRTPKDELVAASPADLDAGHREGMAAVFRKTLWTVLAAALVVAALGLVFHDRNAVIGASAILPVAPALLWFMKRGHVGPAMTATVSLVLCVGCFAVIAGDGIHDVGAGVLTSVVVLAALLLSRRSSRVLALLAVLAFALVGVAELNGILHTRMSHFVTPTEILVPVVVLIAIAFIMQNLAGTLYRSLKSAQLSEQTYREIFNATTDGIFIHDPDTWEMFDVNASATRMLGWSREELLSMTPDVVAAGQPEQSGERIMQLLHAARDEGPQIIEWRTPRKDGSIGWFEITLRAATVRGEARVIASMRDVSDRKAAEERVLSGERLQAVGQLAGGVAHDFNNQLAVILANAELLHARFADDPVLRERTDAIIQCSQRSAELTRQLLAFARKRQPVSKVVDVDVLIREVSALLQHGIDKRIAVRHVVGTTRGARVMGDPGLLQNALLNLGLNARDAMIYGGTLTFETEQVPASALPATLRDACDPEASRFVRVRVRDTGVGMEPDVAARVFEPFFTTKQHGTGLGLAATYGTVRAHGGSIDVSTQLASGTTFDVYLPATDAEVSQPVETPELRDDLRLRVLLAEDETALANVMQAALRSFGCEVTWCADGQAALDRFRANPDAFDLAMLDHSMPRMTGRDLVGRLRALRPGLPVIATSGFGESWGDGELPPNTVFLPKPFALEKLHAAIDTLTREAKQGAGRLR